MRALCTITTCLLVGATLPASAAISQEDAFNRVQSAGYPLVSKADRVAGTWDVWASKDGIAYEVKVNAADGSLIEVRPMGAND